MTTSRYEQAGVSIDAQNRAIEDIKDPVKATATPRVLSAIGSFGGLFDIRFPEMEHPVMVASADGVGTKLKIAFMSGRHDTVGQCLLNHCINDILVQGAKPLFFMDYIATGKLEPGVVADVVRGMAVAGKQNQTAILGGEMAEMPGFYGLGEYDVAGFIVGVVDKPKILGAHNVKAGQSLIALGGTGLHTNGYSLARKIIFEEAGLTLEATVPGTEEKVVDALLAIHPSYYPTLWPLLERNQIHAMAHITGGGFLENIPRVLPPDVDAEIDLSSYQTPPLFKFLVEKGRIDKEESYRVFNMGVGMVLMVDTAHQDAVLDHLSQNQPAWVLGKTVPGSGVVKLS